MNIDLPAANNMYDADPITQVMAPGVINVLFDFLGSRSVAVLCRVNTHWAKKNMKREHYGIYGQASLVAFICAKELLNNFTNAKYKTLRELKEHNIVNVFPSLCMKRFTFKPSVRDTFTLSEMGRDMPQLKVLTIVPPQARSNNGSPRARLELLNDDFSTQFDSFPFLESLTCSVGDQGMRCLRILPKLKKLDLTGSRFNINNLTSLFNLTNLIFLNLSFTNMKDAGLVHVSQLTGLVHLYLSRNPKLTDEGVTSSLINLKALEFLDVSSCSRLTVEGKKNLKKFIKIVKTK